MRTLYVSDLDGTLLNSYAKLSQFSRDKLTELISRGMKITVATARTPYSVKEVLKGLPMNLPLILMNGVILYDLPSDNIISYEQIQPDTVAQVIDAVRGAGVTAFAYSIVDGKLTAYYESLEQPQHYAFYKERVDNYNKHFEKLSCLEELDRNGVVYFTTLYKREVLEPLYKKLMSIENLSCTLYNDIYSDMWYLEVFSSKATKKSGAILVKERYGFDKVVGFGDSENDVSLFEACDVRCAVSNACDEIKSSADVIIGDNQSDGVVRYLLSL